MTKEQYAARGITIQPDTFKAFCGLIYNECGIAMGEGKEALLVSRLGKRLTALGMTDYGDYYRYLTAGGEDADNEMVNFLDCLTTNTTSFFRDGRISEGVENICDDDDTAIPRFLRCMGDVGEISSGAVAFLNKVTPNPPDFFRDKATFRFIGGVLRDMVNEGRDRIRVWSAGCSTGEEPYSVAITFLEHVENFVGDFKIFATDLSTRALCAATRGTYRQREMEIFPLDMRHKYFAVIDDSNGEISYKVREGLSSLISFERLNLAKQPFPMKGSFDIIICRDVMLFFDNPVRVKLIKEFETLLRPGGYLVVGSGENIKGLTTLKPVVGGFIFMKE